MQLNYKAVGEYVIIEKLSDNDSIGSITVVNSNSTLAKDKVLSVGDEAFEFLGFDEGPEVAFLKEEANHLGLGHSNSIYYIHYSKIICVEPNYYTDDELGEAVDK